MSGLRQDTTSCAVCHMDRSKLLTVAIQVVSILLFSLVSAAIQRQEHVFIIFLVYLAVIMFVTAKLGGRGFTRPPENRGPLLFREDQATQVMMRDALLMKEVKEQAKSTLLALLPGLIVLIVIAPLYWQHIDPAIKSIVGQVTDNEFEMRFIGFIAFYVFLIGVMQVPRFIVSKLVKQQKQLLVPRVFSVHRDGILLDNKFMQYSGDLCFRVDTSRKFAELSGKKVQFTVRLYTADVIRLASKLREAGLRECGE